MASMNYEVKYYRLKEKEKDFVFWGLVRFWIDFSVNFSFSFFRYRLCEHHHCLSTELRVQHHIVMDAVLHLFFLYVGSTLVQL